MGVRVSLAARHHTHRKRLCEGLMRNHGISKSFGARRVWLDHFTHWMPLNTSHCIYKMDWPLYATSDSCDTAKFLAQSQFLMHIRSPSLINKVAQHGVWLFPRKPTVCSGRCYFSLPKMCNCWARIMWTEEPELKDHLKETHTRGDLQVTVVFFLALSRKGVW